MKRPMLLAGLACLAVCHEAGAEPPNGPRAYRPGQVISAESFGRRDTAALELEARVDEGATDVLIVRLRDDWQPTGDLPEEARHSQRSRLEAKRARLRGSLGPRTEVRELGELPYMLVYRPGKGEAAGLLRHPDVESVSEETLGTFDLHGSTAQIQAGRDQVGTFSGAGMTIYVIDTGVQRSHPFFLDAQGQTRVGAGACFSTPGILNYKGQSYQTGSTCANGASQDLSPSAGLPCDRAIIGNGCDHGTHVAGIAAGYNGVMNVDGDPEIETFDGVARAATIYPINASVTLYVPPADVGEDDDLDGLLQSGEQHNSVTLRESDVLAALAHINALTSNGSPAVVNISASFAATNSGGNCDAAKPGFRDAIANLKSKGVLVVASAGNKHNASNVSAPACIANAVAVGATVMEDTVANYSNSGAALDFWAPGGNKAIDPAPERKILSSVPEYSAGGSQVSYLRYYGTSMSAPHVAGAIAALMRPASGPAWNSSTALHALNSTGAPVVDPRNGISRKRISVLQATTPPPAKPTVLAEFMGCSGNTPRYAVEAWMPSEISIPASSFQFQYTLDGGANWYTWYQGTQSSMLYGAQQSIQQQVRVRAYGAAGTPGDWGVSGFKAPKCYGGN